jgi:hypothetical protein
MEKLIEHMIQVVESNAKNNQATIPNVEAWAIGWREEAERHKKYCEIEKDPWIFIYGRYLTSTKNTNLSDFYDFLEANYEAPAKLQTIKQTQ